MVNIIDEKSYRNERKFFIEDLSLHQVLLIVKLHPAGFSIAYPPRWVNNIYFDTHQFDSYEENVSGIAERLKVRLRWYDDFFGLAKESILELKIKKGFVGTKQHYDFGPFKFEKGFSDAGWLETLKKSLLPDDVKRRMKDLRPVLFNKYLRRYFKSADKRYRLTVDSDMAYFCPRRGMNYFREKYVDYNKIIVELKYETVNDPGANRISAFFPFRVTKISKYVQGIDKYL